MDTSAFILTGLCLVCVAQWACGMGKELRLLRFIPCTMLGFFGDEPYILPVEMALEDINADPNILPGHTLTYDLIDSQCNAGRSVFKLFEALNNRPPYVMFLGPECSPVAQATGAASHLWNLTQISGAGTAKSLANRTLYPRLFRLGTPAENHNDARFAFLKKFKWSKISTIHMASDFFSEVIDGITKAAIENNVNIITQEIFLHDPTTHIKSLMRHDARIIFVAMYASVGRKLLCSAYRLGFYGPKIVWIFPGWYPDKFWMHNLDGLGCTVEEMQTAVDGAFIIQDVYFNAVEERGLANITALEFEERLHDHPRYSEEYYPFEFLAPRYYDHIWMAALALNCTINRLAEIGHAKGLEDFQYSDGDIGEIIFQCTGNISILGTSGRISFRNGESLKNVEVNRVQDNRKTRVGFYRQAKRPTYFDWYDDIIQWKDGNIPRDSTLIIHMEQTTPTTLYALMCTLSCLGIALSAAFFVFNILYREHRVVKMSSPTANSILLLGCFITYLTPLFKTTEIDHKVQCLARVIMFSVGVTISFGCLFAKLWRVHRVLTTGKRTRRSVNELQVYIIIGILVAVVLLVVVIWECVAPHRVHVRYMEDEIYHVGNDEEVRPFVRICYSDLADHFGGTIYTVQGALLTFGAFIAWETRKVQVEALNDSHLFGLCIYNALFLSAAGLTLSVLLEQQVVMLYVVTSGCLYIVTTVTQCVVFVPKIYSIYHRTDANISNTSSNAVISQSRASPLAFMSPSAHPHPAIQANRRHCELSGHS